MLNVINAHKCIGVHFIPQQQAFLFDIPSGIFLCNQCFM